MYRRDLPRWPSIAAHHRAHRRAAFANWTTWSLKSTLGNHVLHAGDRGWWFLVCHAMIERSSAIGDAPATVANQLAGLRYAPINRVTVLVKETVLVNLSGIRFSLNILKLAPLATTKPGQGHRPHGHYCCGT